MKAVNDKLSDFGSLKGSEDTKLQLHVLAPTGTCSKQFEKKMYAIYELLSPLCT